MIRNSSPKDHVYIFPHRSAVLPIKIKCLILRASVMNSALHSDFNRFFSINPVVIVCVVENFTTLNVKAPHA